MLEFKHASDCLAAFMCAPPPMLGRAIVLTPPNESEPVGNLATRPFRPSRDQFISMQGRSCYFENLPFSIGEEHIRNFVESAVACGKVGEPASNDAGEDRAFIEDMKACAIKGHFPPRYTGTCFVSMGTHQDAIALIDGSHEQNIDGRSIKVHHAGTNE